MQIVVSSEPETIFEPSAENARVLTTNVCPMRSQELSASKSQMWITPSTEPDARHLQSGDTAIEMT
jgi:hypothetical protein